MNNNIYYEDIMDNINNGKLREKLMKLVKEKNIIVIRGLSNADRHLVYKNIYYPLKFEKIIETNDNIEEVSIRIYNCKIKIKSKKEENINDFLVAEEVNNNNNNNNNNNDNEYNYDNKTNTDLSSSESEMESELESECVTESEESYITDEEDNNTKIENILSQCLDDIKSIRNDLNNLQKVLNLLIITNLIVICIIYFLYPIKFIVYYENEPNCYI